MSIFIHYGYTLWFFLKKNVTVNRDPDLEDQDLPMLDPLSNLIKAYTLKH